MKIFFMHIPKTAGISLLRFLEQSMRERSAGVSPRQRDGIWSGESESYPTYEEFMSEVGAAYREYELVCGHYPYHVRELLPPETVVVTLLRDPLARCVSHIKHQIAYERQAGHPEAAADVNEFIGMPRNEMFLDTLANLAVKYLSWKGHPEDVVPEQKLSLDRALAHCMQTRFGLTDELSAFQARLNDELFHRAHAPLPVRFENRSRDSFRGAELTSSNRVRLVELNRLDLELVARVGQLVGVVPVL